MADGSPPVTAPDRSNSSAPGAAVPGPRVSPPLQKRSRRTFERIVAAARELLVEEGPGAVTVQRVVGRAGSSVGSFYARFRGKEDLLAYLATRLRADAEAKWRAEFEGRDWVGMDLEETVRTAVEILSDTLAAGAQGLQSLESVPGGMEHVYVAFREAVARDLSELILLHREEIERREAEQAVQVSVAALLGVLEHSPDLSGEAATMVLGYLAPGPATPDEPQVDFFDIWG